MVTSWYLFAVFHRKLILEHASVGRLISPVLFLRSSCRAAEGGQIRGWRLYLNVLVSTCSSLNTQDRGCKVQSAPEGRGQWLYCCLEHCCVSSSSRNVWIRFAWAHISLETMQIDSEEAYLCGGSENLRSCWMDGSVLCPPPKVIHLYILMYLWLNDFILGAFFFFMYICLASTARMQLNVGAALIKISSWLCFWGQNYFHCDCRKNIFHFLFVLEGKTGCQGFSFHVQLLKIKEELQLLSVRLRWIRLGFESQCKVFELALGGLLWPPDPWLWLYSQRQQSSVMAGGPLSAFLFLEQLKQMMSWSVCVAEGKEEEKKKKTIIYYSNEMRSGRWWKKGRGLAAETLLLATSTIWVGPWRNKKFKGNQRSRRISLAYFKWATLEAGTGRTRGGRCIPCKK